MGQRKRRADGLLEKKRTINGKVMHFYGHTVAEIEAKIDAYKAELAEKETKGEKFEVVYDAWMELRRTQVKPSTLYCSASACAHTRAEWEGYPDEGGHTYPDCCLVPVFGRPRLCKGDGS